ncbi:MFS transporter [Mycolicibacterium aichiense]|uniref:MFS transporter n=1 Tax=Mycolicibacterium aichiense TaxID=1799 RepID=A0AAD1HMQ6_9MYCO|nr:MFS transporter [Mycolicibacterium aichiense]MCV7019505.1 MFS transporter [Mycolicibacterium aichiense]BBX08185.1 MFS transporter [Mycolicibacterium aichiense]STZ81989.1 arabinose efflux permease family protein [Mycolicibacterium aichiense]
MGGPGLAVRNRRARIASAALFLTNGALFANLLPRFPEIKADLGLSNSAFGLAVAAFSAGALLTGVTAAALVRRYRSSVVAVASSLLLAAFTVLAGLAPTGLTLAAALFCAGAADSVTDVAQNVHGLRVQRAYGRFIINSLHAVWSSGAVLGGLIGAGAIYLGIPRAVQLSASALLFGAVCLVAYRYLLPGPDHDHAEPRPGERATAPAGRSVYVALAALVAIAIAGAAVEDAGSSWATLYLRDSLSAPAALAALGYVALVGFQFIGRLVGDRLTDRWGPCTVARAGGVIVAVGMAGALAFPGIPGTIAGFAAAGFGSATLVPGAMHAADELPGLRPGTGLTVLTWLMRVGFLGSPILVGALADAVSLRAGLLTVPLAGLAAVLLARALSPRHRSVRS